MKTCPVCSAGSENSAKFCVKCGSDYALGPKPNAQRIVKLSKKAPKVVALWIGGVGAGALLILTLSVFSTDSSGHATSNNTTEAPVPHAEPPKSRLGALPSPDRLADYPAPSRPWTPGPVEELNMATYLRVRSGMAYSDVALILGPGREISRSDLAGTTTVMYMWQKPNGANMNAMFQNDRLVSKAQFGL